MSTLALLAFLGCLIWTVLLYFAIRYRSWPSAIVVVLAWVSNAFIGNGLIVAASVTGKFTSALIVYLLVDRLDKNPEHVRRVAGAQVADARRDLHHCQADRAAWEAKAVAYQRLLEKHGIKH